ncbi:MAG: hypothetical protein AAEJ65_00650, partial [Planctomycetota bacterium]
MFISIRTILVLLILTPMVAAQDDSVTADDGSAVVLTGVGSESMDLSLEDAIGLALDHNLDLEVQRIGERRNQRDPLIAEAAFDPLFRTGFTWSKSSTTSTGLGEGDEPGNTFKRDNRNYFLGLS